ncbi:CGNR zinc finger domain-containing protein [Mesorhizobium sp. AR02]|uniref:CGNR zinc finger domain-containing protein n=1 Tax=Mesorhizobium sp. AR02 TaxID=2865837 RepID=UPI00215EDBAE|nr:ABATE domain-containing protein [Mesorhizobium sp. AR02]
MGAPVDDLAIRFVNMAAWRLRSEVEERLSSPTELLAWLQSNGVLSKEQFGSLRLVWKQDVDLARLVHGSAIALREVIYNLLSARIDGKAPAEADVAIFNNILASHIHSASIAWRAGAYGWNVPSPHAADSSLLMPIALSAAELLTGIRANKVRQCQDDRGCGWLFVDESRSQNRRWCSMGDCGNRAKAHRHYQRVKKQGMSSTTKASN